MVAGRISICSFASCWVGVCFFCGIPVCKRYDVGGVLVKLSIVANIYDCPYIDEFRCGLAAQIDKDYELIYYTLDNKNKVLPSVAREYDALLFLDIDDVPRPALVSVVKSYIKKYDVVACGMSMFGERTGRFGADGLDWTRYNIFGFGNTCYRAGILQRLFPLTSDSDTIRRAWSIGARTYYRDLPLIKYRQYGQDSSLAKVNGRWVWSI